MAAESDEPDDAAERLEAALERIARAAGRAEAGEDRVPMCPSSWRLGSMR